MINSESDLQDYDEIQEDESNLSEENGEVELIGKRRIYTDKSDPPISALWMQYKEGDLILDPIFQRRKVWDDGRASRLIESVILEVPLPVFYLAESKDGKAEVIDGQQRLRSFFRFLDSEYPLQGLKALPNLNGDKFQALNKETQKNIRNYSIRTITFKKESDENLRFEIFERLNSGAVPLNEQELRNCVYRGKYNELLIELSSNPDFMFLMGLNTPEKRMKDVEYVLRFAAFYHATYLKYKPSMARFLTEDMKEHQDISEEKANILRSAFKTSVSLIRSLLGKNAFKRYYRGTGKNSPNGYWEPNKFNASLYDILIFSFADKDKSQIMANLDTIREAFIGLMTENEDFIYSIEHSTSSKSMVTKRFDIWRTTLDAILESSAKQPRCFSYALKKELYDKNPTCEICNQHITDIDDAAVDHVDQYWLGGQTIPENARLTHRYCNWARPKDDKVDHVTA
ncbi:MAG: DUF262 domain-containing protein [Syntrophaceae bacterium]|nr:DUF262 domain-containing protein [Syntrophaceae bacterium]